MERTLTSDHKKKTLRDFFILAIICSVYLLVSHLLIGFKQEQLVLVIAAFALYFLTPYTRTVIIGYSIFITYWIMYDYMKAFPNYLYNEVAVESLYNMEKAIFGFEYQGKQVTPNEYFLVAGSTFLDILSGLFYINWVPIPLMFSFFLFLTNKREFIYFSGSFLFVNLLGFVVYYLVPAAPPWYVQAHGFEFIPTGVSNAAGLLKFDAYFGVEIFKSIYSKGSNVFASVPSMHSAFPIIVLWSGVRNRLGIANIFFTTFMLGVWFAAVYTSHHYIIDVLAGIACALAGLIVFYKVIIQMPKIKAGIDKMEALITIKKK